MGDGSLCVELCRQSGEWGEVLVMVLIGARAIWAGWRSRQLATKASQLEAQKVELVQQVQQLSLRPPAVPEIALKLPPLPDLVRAARASQPAADLQDSLPPERPKSDEPPLG